MTSDSGNLSIDFLAGFTIFMIAFIWVISMIPGLLVNLQGYTIDYDAVAYRTGVILAEDPGEPSLPTSVIPWENLISRNGVVRFGLAVSKDTPDILSRKKVDRFFCSSVFSYPADYQNRSIFGDYPYQFNISLIELGSTNPPRYIGGGMPATSSTGYIRRLVRIKEPAVAVVNANSTAHPEFLSNATNATYEGNETVHEFSILINKTELLKDKILDPVYQINPGQEQTIINITHLDQTMLPAETITLDNNSVTLWDRTPCFNISLTNITIRNYEYGNFQYPPLPPYTTVIDGVEYNSSSPLPYIKSNISLILDPPTYWSVIDNSSIKLKFTLVRTCPLDVVAPDGITHSYPWYNFTGSRFLNNTFTSPFSYNYSPNNVIQPYLQEAVLGVKVGSGERTVTEILIENLAAAFRYDVTSGSPTISVQFIDQSKGSPVEWDWDFGDLTSHGTFSNPTHVYATAGIKTVKLTVKDASGNTASVTKTIDLSAPVAGFSATPLSGNAPLTVTFTDASTGGAPTSWKWAYKNATVGWTQFATTQNPSWTFANGTYDINLTATNIFGSDDEIKTAYITALPPTVTGISPTSGPLAGGTLVTITGTGFTSAATVSFGGTPGTGVTFVSSTQITVTSPAHAAGTVDVTVTTPGGTSATSLNDHFTYTSAPTVTSINPTSGPVAGGTLVTITGTGFTSAATVSFGGTAGTSVTFISSTQITAISPARAAGGTVDVRVTTAGGTSAIVAGDRFTYTGVAPTVTSINPTSGPAAGGTSVTITGTGFTSAATVNFGATAGTGVTFVSDTQITVNSPAKAAGGTVDVKVTTVYGTSAIVAGDRFTYTGVAPTVTSINPTSGPAAGGTSVTITGTGFTSAATVSFGGTAGTGVTFVSDTQITATSPAKAAGGTVDVRVTTADGTSAIVAGDRFTYTGVAPTVTSINPTSGPAAGGTSVTITGTGFTSAATVNFGVTAGTGVTFVSDTQITVTSPAKAAGGTVDVRVTTVGGTSAIVAGDKFTYTGVVPIVTSISPTTGSHLGSTSVTITGTGFTSAATVSFGGTAGTGVTFVSDTQITVISPAHATGIVDVRVTTVGGTSAIVAGDKFTYT